MGRPAKIRPESITNCTVRLIARGGPEAATIRAISNDMGVNEAALYRHYKSKEEILWDAYARIVEDMARQKRELAQSNAAFHAILREWIRLSFEYFDNSPDAFTYVLLLPPPSSVKATDIVSVQGRIFLSLVRRARKAGEIRAISPQLAFSHFSGILLNIPRLIREGTLRGPAVQYVDEVAEAAWRVLRPD